MARNTSGKPPSPSRIRFVMVEAELGDGDIGQITQAIQNALRSPTASPMKRISAPTASGTGASAPDVDPEIDEIEESEVIEQTAGPAKPRGPRRPPPAPSVVEIDMHSETSLAKFAEGKDASSQAKKYLIAAAWLKEHRGIDGVTADHIYTCFRSLGWSVGIPDFGQPLRNLKHKKFFTQNAKGEYEINHLGLDYVKKLGGSDGAS